MLLSDFSIARYFNNVLNFQIHNFKKRRVITIHKKNFYYLKFIFKIFNFNGYLKKNKRMDTKQIKLNYTKQLKSM